MEQPSLLDQIMAELVPIILSALGIVTTAFIAWLTTWLRTKFKLEEEAAHSVALNTAVDNAAGGVINEMGESAVTTVVAPTSPAVKRAVTYVRERNPDAVAYFEIPPAAIAEKIVNSVGKQTAPSLKG